MGTRALLKSRGPLEHGPSGNQTWASTEISCPRGNYWALNGTTAPYWNTWPDGKLSWALRLNCSWPLGNSWVLRNTGSHGNTGPQPEITWESLWGTRAPRGNHGPQGNLLGLRGTRAPGEVTWASQITGPSENHVNLIREHVGPQGITALNGKLMGSHGKTMGPQGNTNFNGNLTWLPREHGALREITGSTDTWGP